MNKTLGASADADQALVNEAPAGLRHTASVLNALIERCEVRVVPKMVETAELFQDAFRACLPKPGRVWVTDNTGNWTREYTEWQGRQSGFYELIEVGAFLEAAIMLLPDGADWRKFTPISMSAYAASPYNAAAQVKHSGYGATDALRLCSVALKLRLAPIQKAIATEAQRAATVKQGAVEDDGAGPKDIAQRDTP